MPTIQTCGHETRRTEFSYRGGVEQGVVIEFDSGDFEINSLIINRVLDHFRGREAMGGFSVTAPTPGGVGEFLAQQVAELTPRHASFLCAILNHEGYAQCSLNGNTVVVQFNA